MVWLYKLPNSFIVLLFGVIGAALFFGVLFFLSLRSPTDAMKAGMVYVSEDRIGQSLIMDFGVLTNASLPTIDRADVSGSGAKASGA